MIRGDCKINNNKRTLKWQQLLFGHRHTQEILKVDIYHVNFLSSAEFKLIPSSV